MRAKYMETRQYAVGTQADVSVSVAARACGFRVRSESPLEYKLRARFNMWSYGETLKVRVGEVDGQLMVHVASWCSMPFQVADWGKNRKNVAAFFDSIESQLPSPVERRVLPHCPRCEFLVVSSSPVCTDCGHPLTPLSRGAWVGRMLRLAVVIPIAAVLIMYTAGLLVYFFFGIAWAPLFELRVLLPGMMLNIPLLLVLLLLSRHFERSAQRAGERSEQAGRTGAGCSHRNGNHSNPSST